MIKFNLPEKSFFSVANFLFVFALLFLFACSSQDGEPSSVENNVEPTSVVKTTPTLASLPPITFINIKNKKLKDFFQEINDLAKNGDVDGLKKCVELAHKTLSNQDEILFCNRLMQVSSDYSNSQHFRNRATFFSKEYRQETELKIKEEKSKLNVENQMEIENKSLDDLRNEINFLAQKGDVDGLNKSIETAKVALSNEEILVFCDTLDRLSTNQFSQKEFRDCASFSSSILQYDIELKTKGGKSSEIIKKKPDHLRREAYLLAESGDVGGFIQCVKIAKVSLSNREALNFCSDLMKIGLDESYSDKLKTAAILLAKPYQQEAEKLLSVENLRLKEEEKKKRIEERKHLFKDFVDLLGKMDQAKINSDRDLILKYMEAGEEILPLAEYFLLSGYLNDFARDLNISQDTRNFYARLAYQTWKKQIGLEVKNNYFRDFNKPPLVPPKRMGRNWFGNLVDDYSYKGISDFIDKKIIVGQSNLEKISLKVFNKYLQQNNKVFSPSGKIEDLTKEFGGWFNSTLEDMVWTKVVKEEKRKGLIPKTKYFTKVLKRELEDYRIELLLDHYKENTFKSLYPEQQINRKKVLEHFSTEFQVTDQLRDISKIENNAPLVRVGGVEITLDDAINLRNQGIIPKIIDPETQLVSDECYARMVLICQTRDYFSKKVVGQDGIDISFLLKEFEKEKIGEGYLLSQVPSIYYWSNMNEFFRPIFSLELISIQNPNQGEGWTRKTKKAIEKFFKSWAKCKTDSDRFLAKIEFKGNPQKGLSDEDISFDYPEGQLEEFPEACQEMLDGKKVEDFLGPYETPERIVLGYYKNWENEILPFDVAKTLIVIESLDSELISQMKAKAKIRFLQKYAFKINVTSSQIYWNSRGNQVNFIFKKTI